ncbi:hypothetical protein M6D81_25075 [Paenibacillus sp. J5C_2022]|uniref:hypothetical protein n=1 Tax=Paenibacillus sp. J5C2022 TaxID=2977129 RepID=UPI0021CF0EC0|nr:hypothetical protein [Paenibacillus sp. J5C2022]MCU6711981.1 hypothetical protein [Paenibacillus sp. J5C2022]
MKFRKPFCGCRVKIIRNEGTIIIGNIGKIIYSSNSVTNSPSGSGNNGEVQLENMKLKEIKGWKTIQGKQKKKGTGKKRVKGS